MPFMAMRELWHGGNGQNPAMPETPSLLGAWWGSFIIGGIMMTISSFMLQSNPDAVLPPAFFMLDGGIALRLVSAWCLYDIIRRITLAQMNRITVADTFA